MQAKPPKSLSNLQL
jgi:hypothetical protein